MNNQERANTARTILSQFRQLIPNDDDVETLASDLFADIFHLLESENIDPNVVLNRAEMHYESERKGD